MVKGLAHVLIGKEIGRDAIFSEHAATDVRRGGVEIVAEEKRGLAHPRQLLEQAQRAGLCIQQRRLPILGSLVHPPDVGLYFG